MAEDRVLQTMIDNGSLFNSISESAPFGLFVTDTEGSCVYANAEYLRITGLKASEIPGIGWSRTIHAEDRSNILERLYTATETHKEFSSQYRIIKSDGSTIRLAIRAVPIETEGRSTGIAGYIEDITLRLKMENQLRINFAAMESSTSMIMITDNHGLITWVNPAFSRETGYSFSEIEGKNPGFLSVSTDSPIKEALKTIITTGLPWKGEVYNRRKDGSIFLEEEIITPITGSDGKIGHFLAIKRDITEQRKNEQKITEYSEHLEDLVKERTRDLEEAQKKIQLQHQIEQELTIAAQIQKNLLPEKPPEIPDFDIACRAFAAHYISGDLYDFVVKGKNLYIIMADISGKGMPAALLSASARSIIREKIDQKDSPAEIMELVNQTLYPDLHKTDMFITIMLIQFKTETGLCTYSNAGHTRTMHFHGDTHTLDYLAATNMPVGIFPSLEAKEISITMNPLDVLFLYSDGLTEASSPEGFLFGEEKLATTFTNALTATYTDVLSKPKTDLEQILSAIISSVDTFVGNRLSDDDRSLILLRRNHQTFSHSCVLSSSSIEELISLLKNKTSSFGENFAAEIELVITELLTNIIRHAYGIEIEQLDSHAVKNTTEAIAPVIDIKCTSVSNKMIIDIYDRGKPFDKTAYSEPDPLQLQVGGYGYLLIQKLTDTVVYTREADNKNHWHIEKTLKELE